jgi:hypothetical protein
MSRSNRLMGVRRPAWWSYPERCENGHEWAPGLIIMSWSMCDCPPTLAAGTPGPSGHLAVYCRHPGCRSVWYRPRHEPAARA